ncbi:hypothetical protein lbkm_1270 [Lachnospiraceae bacterium KM106-2]|nr:hypothetical protein lbkm_1270 [Lachnospiraceae bacterium KM106-2]
MLTYIIVSLNSGNYYHYLVGGSIPITNMRNYDLGEKTNEKAS